MKSKMIRGAVWLAASRALVNLLGFASTLFLAHLLLPVDFGLVAIATTVIAIVSSVTDIPLSAALIQHADPDRRHFDSSWTLSALRGAILAMLLALSAVPLARFYHDNRLSPLIVAMAVVTFIQGLYNPTMILFERHLVFHQEFLMGVSKKLSGFVISVFIAWRYHSYWALIIGTAVSETIGLGITYLLAPYRPRLSLSHAKELLSFSVWLSLTQVVLTVNYRFDNLFIGYYLTNADVGQYSYGDNIAALPTREATTPIAQMLFPAFTAVRDDPARLRAAYVRAQTLLCAIGLPVGLGFATIARPLVHIVLGDKWAPAVIVIQVLSSIFALQTLATSLQPLAMALGETKALFRRDLANLAVRLPLVVGGLIFGGFAGIVFARLGSGTAALFMNMALVKRMLGLSINAQFVANRRGLAASTAMVAAVLFFQHAAPVPATFPAGCAFLAEQVTIGGAVYVACCCGAWMAEGLPQGPEAEIVGLIRTALRFLKAWRLGRA